VKDPRYLEPVPTLTLVVRERRRPTRADRVLASGFATLEEAIAAAEMPELRAMESAIVEDETGAVIYQRVGRAS
jgi:hypothetical protein